MNPYVCRVTTIYYNRVTIICYNSSLNNFVSSRSFRVVEEGEEPKGPGDEGLAIVIGIVVLLERRMFSVFVLFRSPCFKSPCQTVSSK